ncbi:Dbl homology domain-containing protein [Halteromyces radiatus]|uniref:Dbl homology domain-containing protein n=1 Tax=Halteromyces radiatus TaxID=101107 RepID=UPI0022204DB3|nr:Dbl homology domain-containing protein [Halteromyces radiatus]KAI8099515.1 Dbl homology domain-containing protein [Halteromyces radiatus]
MASCFTNNLVIGDHIPDCIKKSYQQQLLPIRQQSLPSYQPKRIDPPVRKSSISANTHDPRKKNRQNSVKHAKRKISVRYRSNHDDDFLSDYYQYLTMSFATTLSHTCYQSMVLNELYQYSDDQPYSSIWAGSEIVNQLLEILGINDRDIALDYAGSLPLIQMNGPPLDLVSDTWDIFYRLPTLSSNQQQRQKVSILSGKKTRIEYKDEFILSYLIFLIELYQSVYTPLTKCYAPLCTRDRPCYSYYCPNKTIHVSKINSNCRSSSIETKKDMLRQQKHYLWIHSVPRTLVYKTCAMERHRQEAIYELIQTEIDFVDHLRYIKKAWIEPLLSSTEIVQPSIVKHVFWNWQDVLLTNTRLMEALVDRQSDHLICHVGDVFLTHLTQFEPLIIYGTHQMIGQFYLTLEKKRNPHFVQFIKEIEQQPEANRLDLNGYLTKITTRLARYPLLLTSILQSTALEHPDHGCLTRAVEILQQLLLRLDQQIDQVGHQFELKQISERLVYSKSSVRPVLNLELNSPHRRLIHQGRMQLLPTGGEIHVFLFDHLILFTKIKVQDALEYYRPFRKWIPLYALTFAIHDMEENNKKTNKERHHLYIIAFQYRMEVPITLVTPNENSRRLWVDKITQSMATCGDSTNVIKRQ